VSAQGDVRSSEGVAGKLERARKAASNDSSVRDVNGCWVTLRARLVMLTGAG
jgi:hypothetical protein